MPAFILLIIIAAIILWFLCSFLYQPIGRFIGMIINNVREAIKDKEYKEEKGECKDEKKR